MCLWKEDKPGIAERANSEWKPRVSVPTSAATDVEAGGCNQEGDGQTDRAGERLDPDKGV